MTVDHLMCHHCGCDAIASDEEGLFADGDGGACMTCGWPGRVNTSEEDGAWWNDLGEEGSRCDDPACLNCGMEG